MATIFANVQERDTFAATVKTENSGDYEGLPVLGTTLDKLRECIGATIGGSKWTKLHLQAYQARCETQEAERGVVAIKTSRAGLVSVYGFGQWPINLYAASFVRLLALGSDIIAHINADVPAFWPGKKAGTRKINGVTTHIAASQPVIVRLSKERGDNNVLFSGEAAVEEAKRLGIFKEVKADDSDD